MKEEPVELRQAHPAEYQDRLQDLVAGQTPLVDRRLTSEEVDEIRKQNNRLTFIDTQEGLRIDEEVERTGYGAPNGPPLIAG